MGFRLGILILFALVTNVAAPARADTRIALVIGNSAYRSVAPLLTPRDDAKLLATVLKDLGFTIVGGGPILDLDKQALDRAVVDFGEAIQGADVALFYYAGHGLEVDGVNYLLPVDANPTRKSDLYFQSLDVGALVRQMKNGSKLSLIFLDACRNNPWASRGLRDVKSGLSTMDAPKNTVISFSTRPGGVALDGDRNSPYAKALAAAIVRKPAFGLLDTLNSVGVAVLEATEGDQQPWQSTSPIDHTFYFTAAPAPPEPADETVWQYLKSTTDVASLRSFIAKNPKSPRRGEALARLNNLLAPPLTADAPTANTTTILKPTTEAPILETTKVSGNVLRAGWKIHVGSFDAENDAEQRLTKAQAKMGHALDRFTPFTEPVLKGEKTLYRARFAGFQGKVDAESTCKQLKRLDIDCMTIKD